jgi:hypothetical protein
MAPNKPELSALIFSHFDERISPFHPVLMFLHYLLLFPYGDFFWGMKYVCADGGQSGGRAKVSILEYYFY